MIGPLVRMYEDPAAFKLCGVLSKKNGVVERHPAPIADEFGRAYGAWVLQLISDHFDRAGQITLSELDSKAGWKSIPGWGPGESHAAVDLMERKGIIQVDRQMNPWVIRPRLQVEEAWEGIYNDLL